MLPLGKTEDINKNLILFLDKTIDTIAAFEECLKNFCSGDIKAVREDVKKIDVLESEADDIRRRLEKLLYVEALIPEKEDKIDLIDNIDDVTDQAEIASWETDLYVIKLPKEIKDIILEIGKDLVKLTEALKKCVGSLLIDARRAVQEAKNVETQRNQIRALIRQLRREIFTSKLEPKNIYILSNLSYRMLRVADACEKASDRVSAMAVRIA